MRSFSKFLFEKVNLKTYESALDDPWFKDFKIGFECEFIVPETAPHFSSENKRRTKETSFKSIAKSLSNFLKGEKITFSDTYHDSNKVVSPVTGQVVTHVEPDSSISLSNLKPEDVEKYHINMEKFNNWLGIEISSRTFPTIRECFDGLSNVFSFIEQSDGITNTTTGFHFTVSGFPKNTPWIRVSYLMDSRSILKQFDRQDNAYAQSQLERLNKNDLLGATKIKNELGDWNKALSHNALRYGSKLIRPNKYFDFNLKDGGEQIEIRSIGNWMYHKRIDEIKMIILRFLWAVKKANVDGIYYKKELKKIIKNVGTQGISDLDLKTIVANNFSGVVFSDDVILKRTILEYISNTRNYVDDNIYYNKRYANALIHLFLDAKKKGQINKEDHPNIFSYFEDNAISIFKDGIFNTNLRNVIFERFKNLDPSHIVPMDMSALRRLFQLDNTFGADKIFRLSDEGFNDFMTFFRNILYFSEKIGNIIKTGIFIPMAKPIDRNINLGHYLFFRALDMVNHLTSEYEFILPKDLFAEMDKVRTLMKTYNPETFTLIYKTIENIYKQLQILDLDGKYKPDSNHLLEEFDLHVRKVFEKFYSEVKAVDFSNAEKDMARLKEIMSLGIEKYFDVHTRGYIKRILG